MAITLLIVGMLLTHINAMRDAHQIAWRIPIDYTFNTLARLAFGLISGLIHFWCYGGVTESLLFIALQSSIFWIQFDATLNLMRNKELLYVGNTSLIDRLFNGLPAGAGVMVFCKIAFFATSLRLYLHYML